MLELKHAITQIERTNQFYLHLLNSVLIKHTSRPNKYFENSARLPTVHRVGLSHRLTLSYNWFFSLFFIKYPFIKSILKHNFFLLLKHAWLNNLLATDCLEGITHTQ
jgi:hypothetical protein